MPTVTGPSDAAPYLTTIALERSHTLIADEPTDLGGQDLGPTPGELLAASLSACTCITVRMYAARKQWPLQSIEAIVTFERDERHVITSLGIVLQMHGDLGTEQRQRLLKVAEQCPIHKTLTGAVPIATQLE